MPSPRRQGRRTVMGGIIIATLFALALIVFFLDRVEAWFHRTYTVVAVFPEAPGLRSGSPVWVAGVQVGRIRDIALLPPGDTLARVALNLEIERSIRSQLRRDSQVRFASVRMIGEKVIEVLPGSPHSPELAEGDTLHVPRAMQPEQLLAGAGELRLSLDSLRADAATMRANFAHRRPRMAAAMREAALARKELAALQAGMRGGSLGRLMTLQQPGGPLDRVQRRIASVQRLVGEGQKRMGRARRELAPEQRALMGHVKELQGEITRLRTLLDTPAGTLGRMQSDSAVQRAFQGARAQLDSLVTESKKKPWRYVF